MPVSERPLHVFGSYQCAYDADLGVMKLLAVTGWQRSNKTPFVRAGCHVQTGSNRLANKLSIGSLGTFFFFLACWQLSRERERAVAASGRVSHPLQSRQVYRSLLLNRLSLAYQLRSDFRDSLNLPLSCRTPRVSLSLDSAFHFRV